MTSLCYVLDDDVLCFMLDASFHFYILKIAVEMCKLVAVDCTLYAIDHLLVQPPASYW